MAVPMHTPRMPAAATAAACFLLALAAFLYIAAAARTGWPGLAWALWVALAALASGLVVAWHSLVRPLRAVLQAVDLMQRTGQLKSLPAALGGEVGILARGLTALAAQTEVQRRKLVDSILDLQRLNEELDHLAHIKDDFLMAINHQFRTPLTTLVDGLAMLREGAGAPEDAGQLLEAMQQNAARLTQLIEDLLDLSLLKAGRRPLLRQPSDLAAVLRQVQARWVAGPPPRAVTLACDPLPPVYMDPQAVQEVLDHLVRNALRHAAGDPRVAIQAVRQGEYARVIVANRGPGLTPEQAGRLFEPFAHLHTPDAPGSEGSGLGLAFCRHVVERHRGSILMQRDEAARETRLVVELPLAVPAFLFDEAVRTAQEAAEREASAVGVLLVQADQGLVDQAEPLLRQNTARRDQFIRLDARRLAIVAVAQREGLDAMRHRIGTLLDRAGLEPALGLGTFPADGERAEQVLAAAAARCQHAPASSVHATMAHQPREACR